LYLTTLRLYVTLITLRITKQADYSPIWEDVNI